MIRIQSFGGVPLMITEEDGSSHINFQHPAVKEYLPMLRMTKPGITDEEIAGFLVSCVETFNMLKGVVKLLSLGDPELEEALILEMGESIKHLHEEASERIKEELSKN